MHILICCQESEINIFSVDPIFLAFAFSCDKFWVTFWYKRDIKWMVKNI